MRYERGGQGLPSIDVGGERRHDVGQLREAWITIMNRNEKSAIQSSESQVLQGRLLRHADNCLPRSWRRR